MKGRDLIGHHPTKPENKPQKEPLRDFPPRQAGFFRPPRTVQLEPPRQETLPLSNNIAKTQILSRATPRRSGPSVSS